MIHVEKGREDSIFERWKKINIPTKQIQHSAVNGGVHLQYDERNSGKKKKKRKKETTLKTERLLTLWGTVSPSTSVSVAVGRHRCPPYCRHNVSSYFTDKLTLIGNFLDLQQRLARLRDVCTVYTLFGSAVQHLVDVVIGTM
ncbi:hypothetical protein T01_4306 [Trichinella spiralis]|uniref:Uncharacterized protein n=1 Tax=Trichinella spiralis TaxID=6334 RepID=A0A0V1BKP5_TRISP|nr:hypothetical protein T01_4306 [Trichinella spiralis]